MGSNVSYFRAPGYGFLSPLFCFIFSPCCNTPQHLMTRWQSFRKMLMQNCQAFPKPFWRVCWRNLLQLQGIPPQSSSLKRRARPSRQSQAGPQPVWCPDLITISTKVGDPLLHPSTQDKNHAVICKISSSLFFSCFPFFSIKLTTASRCSCILWTCAACYVNTAAWRPVLNPSPPQWWR